MFRPKARLAQTLKELGKRNEQKGSHQSQDGGGDETRYDTGGEVGPKQRIFVAPAEDLEVHVKGDGVEGGYHQGGKHRNDDDTNGEVDGAFV